MLHWYNVTMYLTDAKAYLDVIKDAEQRRAKLLPDDPDAAYDQWLFHDAPFINELCIVFLVALRHHVEHRLTFFAACAADGGKPISRTEFSDRMKQLSKPKAKWDAIEKRLHPDQCVHYQVIEALQHLANAYKHNANLEPDHRLLKHLGLPPNRTYAPNERGALTYAPIPESEVLQNALAAIVGLPANSPYSQIATVFVERTQGFLDDLEARNTISRVKGGRVGFSSDQLAH